MLKRFSPVLVLVAVCWIVFGVNAAVWHGDLTRYGIVPRRLTGLPGILWAPFLHASFKHLAANTAPLLVLGGILCARGKREFQGVMVAGIVLGGGLTWLFARQASHVGASGLVFACFGYLVSLGVFNRTIGSLLLSLACLVAYGGMLWGVLPTAAHVSWEGHLAGLVAGIALGWLRAKPDSSGQQSKPQQALPLDGSPH